MGSSFKFVHCADLHLGSRFRGVSSSDPALGERMRRSTFDSFSSIVDMAVRERADALIISGDVYDDGNALPSTRHFLAKELERAGMPVFICRGNHDSRTSWDQSIPYPGNVHEFGTEPESIVVDSRGGSFEVVGMSFCKPHEDRNLAVLLSGRRDMFTIGCLHCDVDSVSEGRSYAPCRLSDLSGRAVDYWALGHIHKRQVLSNSPYVVYPGNIQGRNHKESGQKGAYLVSVSSGVVTNIRFVPTQSILWRDMRVDIAGKTLEDVMSEIRSAVSPTDMLRITLTGSGELDGMLRSGDDAVGLISSRVGCTVSEVNVETSPFVDYTTRSGDDMVSKIIEASRSLEADGRDSILGILGGNRIIAAHMDEFSGMTDDELNALVEDASKLLISRMGAGQ